MQKALSERVVATGWRFSVIDLGLQEEFFSTYDKITFQMSPIWLHYVTFTLGSAVMIEYNDRNNKEEDYNITLCQDNRDYSSDRP
jgi:hypothetical protein